MLSDVRCRRFSILVATVAFFSNPARCDEPEVVENPRHGTWAALGKSFSLTEELSIGVEDGDPNYVLGFRVRGIAENSKRHIFVLDAQFDRVQEYDSSGTYVRTIGQKGEGPGDFRFPTVLTIDRLDSLYVADRGKIIVFSPNGEYVREISIPHPDAGIQSLVLDQEHNIYFAGATRTNHRVIHKYDWRDGTVSSFCETYREQGFDGRKAGQAETLYGGGVIALDAMNRIIFTRRFPYEIRRFSPQGELLTVISREHDSKKLLDTSFADTPPRPAEVDLSIGIIPLPDGRFMNVLSKFPEPERPREYIVDLFDASGVLLASKKLGRATALVCANDLGQLYGYERFGEYPKVVRLRLTYD